MPEAPAACHGVEGKLFGSRQGTVDVRQKAGVHVHDPEQHTDHNHGRDEVRHIGDVFHHRFPPLAANGVQKQSEDDGKREPDDQRIKGKDQGVGKRVSEGVAGEETVEML